VKRPNKRDKGNSDKMKNSNNPPHKLVKMDKKQIDELLRSALQDYMVQHSSVKVEKSKNMHNLATLVSEYLGAFLILGYDMNGAPISCIHAKNQMDADALSAAINRFILNAAEKHNPDDTK
jgi:hypothetical protein